MECVLCKKYKQPLFCLSKNLLCINHSKLLFNAEIKTIQKIYEEIYEKIYEELAK